MDWDVRARLLNLLYFWNHLPVGLVNPSYLISLHSLPLLLLYSSFNKQTVSHSKLRQIIITTETQNFFFKDNINVMFPLPGITFLSPMLFPGGSDSKASAHNAGDPGSIPWVGKIPWRRKGQPTPVLLPRKFHAWRSLVGYSPWGHKESDTPERLHFSEP